MARAQRKDDFDTHVSRNYRVYTVVALLLMLLRVPTRKLIKLHLTCFCRYEYIYLSPKKATRDIHKGLLRHAPDTYLFPILSAGPPGAGGIQGLLLLHHVHVQGFPRDLRQLGGWRTSAQPVHQTKRRHRRQERRVTIARRCYVRLYRWWQQTRGSQSRATRGIIVSWVKSYRPNGTIGYDTGT